MKRIYIILLLAFNCYLSFAQTTNNQVLLYDFNLYQKLNQKIYSTDKRFHSAIKPYFLDDSIIALSIDSIFNIGLDTGKLTWAKKKIFHEHLIDVKKKDYTFYADFLPDFQIGYDNETDRDVWLNTRGYQLGGTIGNKFSFYTSGFENQARFPTYFTNFVNENGIIPSQVNDKFGPSRAIKDWAYSTAVLSYTPSKYINFTLGQDKNFIGDGYRSMLLSDVAANYPFFKATATLGNVKYMAMWAQFQDLRSPQFSYDNGYRKKWGAFHYLDWNVNNRLSLGFFDAIIWQDADEEGKRGFDFSYINPLIFLRPVEGKNGSPDNALLGFNAKYELTKRMSIYGQFMLDEFTAKEVFAGTGYWANKYAYQIGFKTFNLFNVKQFNSQFEFNTARPFTYTQRSSLLNYGHYNQPLAHPYGANFKEVVGILNYSVGRFNFMSKLNVAEYGLDLNNLDNNGKDIFKSYLTRNADYGNINGQGIKTNLTFLELNLAYVLNPTYNLRFEAGFINRSEINTIINNQTNIFTFGLRSSFRNLYNDF